MLALALLSLAAPAQAQLVGTTTQLTTNPATQLDPAISGDLVVFTDLRNGNEDVYYVNIATLAEVQVTSGAGNQRLNDVDGSTIVFTDMTAPGARINAYDVGSALTTTLTSGPTDQNPRIDGSTVAFERGPSSAYDVWTVQLGTLATAAVAGTAAHEQNPVVDGTRVVYERHITPTAPGEIVVFDTSTSTETVLGALTLDNRRPDIDGDLVVWDVLTPAGDTDIMIHDLSVGLGKTLALPGNQRAAHISGRVVAFDDDSSGSSDVLVHHVDLLVTEPIAAGPGTEFLNDIDGGRVVYTSNAAGNFDIWLFEFELGPPDCETSDDLCVDETGYTTVFEQTWTRARGRPHHVGCAHRSGGNGHGGGGHGGGGHGDDEDGTAFSATAGPAILVVHNHGCSSATGTLNGEPVLFPSDLNQNVECFTREVELGADNVLDVGVRSRPGCSIDVSILTEDQCVETVAAESCEASALGGAPSALCGLALLGFMGTRRRRAA
ncbi:MAG: hypothetical protein IT382_01185 [Deltaproteobacteria bacterium]|nr:hypothetical protein [Deltaproteobacteria bacterium]